MTTWSNRARGHFLGIQQNSTTETTETPLSVVLTVQSDRICKKHDVEIQTASAANNLVPITSVKSVIPETEVATDPDRWCYPNSSAMNSREIDTFMERVARFNSMGVGLEISESLADKLVNRDRENGTHRACLECIHLSGFGATDWRCDNWHTAGITTLERDAKSPRELVVRLKRCQGFSGSIRIRA
jgi:hypothetical protein